MKTDLELRQDVERELAWDPKVDASKIAVTAKNGVVTLAGFKDIQVHLNWFRNEVTS